MDQSAPKVLLVDDEADFLATLAKRLGLRGLQVSKATSGGEALELLAGQPVDVVVMDVRMPGMDGITATRRLKAAHPLVEVILLTGHADLDASLEGMELGAFDYLLKPVELDELVFKIQDAHKRKAMQEEKMARLRSARQAGGQA